MAEIPIQNPNGTVALGEVVLTPASAGGDEFPNNARTLLIAEISTPAVKVFTLFAQRDKVFVPAFGTLDIDDIVVTTSAAGAIVALQCSPGGYNNNTNGRASVGVDNDANVSYACIRLANVS